VETLHICVGFPVVQFGAPPTQPPAGVPPARVNVPFITDSQLPTPLQSPFHGQPLPDWGGPLAGRAGEAGHSLDVEIPLITQLQWDGQEQPPQLDTATHGGAVQLVGEIVITEGQADPPLDALDKENVLLPLQANGLLNV
jgi:hypothetical protein